MEGADPIVAPEQARLWWDDGLRMVGLAHYGPSAYAFGTGSAGPLTAKGRELLRVMDELGMMLDVSHLTDESFHEALDLFQGPVLASHSNCRALVPGDRQLDDAMIRRMIERDGVIGAVMDAWMLQPDWVRGETTNEQLTLEAVVDQIDHVCQLAGNSRHAAIGTDLDGGYGIEQTPQRPRHDRRRPEDSRFAARARLRRSRHRRHHARQLARLAPPRLAGMIDAELS